MVTPAAYPTPYPDVNAMLAALLSGVQATLGGDLLGLYLHGSLAAGDFDPARSDIDFLVVTTGELPSEMLPVLAAMHRQIADRNPRWATHCEGSYIPQRAVRRHDPTHSHHLALRVDGSFGVDAHGSEWIIQRHILRERGVTLLGDRTRHGLATGRTA